MNWKRTKVAGYEKTDTSVLDQASDWFLRLREPSCSARDKREFEHWLQRSDEHGRAWEKICRTWELMGEIPSLQADAQQVRTSTRFASRRFLTGRRVATAIVAMAAVALLTIAAPSLFIAYRADFVTAVGERRTIPLQDGSTIELGAASAIDTSFSGDGRHVRLLAGEAFFDVAHDPARPFTVMAGDVNVTVLGTAFDVRMASGSTTVELLRGSVDMRSVETEERVILTPGDVATFARQTGKITRETVSPADMAEWRNGRLFVNDVTIASVIETLRRYHPAWIRVVDGEIGENRVTGLYDLSNPDGVLDALVKPFGARVHHLSPYLRLITK